MLSFDLGALLESRSWNFKTCATQSVHSSSAELRNMTIPLDMYTQMALI